MRVIRLALAYFAIVFACGFALGVARTLWVAPATGERAAELAEAPLMLLATVLAARALVRRNADLVPRTRWLAAGGLALALLLAVELTVVLALRGLTLAAYVAARDPVAGTVYVALLALFAAMPFLLAVRAAP